MTAGKPQSFNRYAYVENDPVNLVDPSGLYEACAHEAMTKYLATVAGGRAAENADKLGQFAGGGKGGADSGRYSATNPINIGLSLFGLGPSAKVHFASNRRLNSEIGKLGGYIEARNFQAAAFTLHSIQDVIGAHAGLSLPAGQLFTGSGPDRAIGDEKFLNAANATLRALTGNNNASLSSQQVKDLIAAVVNGCGKKADKFKITPPASGAGGGGGGGGGGYIGGGCTPYYWVYYISWDGGRTWEEQSRSYAGCW